MYFVGANAQSQTRLWRIDYLIGREAYEEYKRLLSGPTVDIIVGKEKKSWKLHRNLLCHYSSYFEAEFIGNEVPKSKKPGEQRLDLPDEDPAGFELFVKWLYQGQLDDVSDLPQDQKYDYSVACHKLYMLCDRFDIGSLKNVSIDQYRKGLFEAGLVPDAEEINEIYRQSPYRSPFRKLMTQIAARQIMDPESDKDADTYRACFENNPDFAVDMINAIKTGTGGVLFDDPTEDAECDYHDHSNGQSCLARAKRRGAGSSNLDSQQRSPREVPARRIPTISEGPVNHVNGIVKQQRHVGFPGRDNIAREDEASTTARRSLTSTKSDAFSKRSSQQIDGEHLANGVNGHTYRDENRRPRSSGSDKDESSLSPSKRKQPPKLRRRSPPPSGAESRSP